MTEQKTYWHLLAQKRMPNEYEIVTSKLLCYTGEGFTGKRFEVDVPLQPWYRQYQQGSSFSCSSWEKFRDPRETTYTKYTELQREKEVFVDGILDEIEATGYDKQISPAWLPELSRLVAPLRYPGHGFQMLAAYVGHTAPSGRIAIAAALQAGDEMRRVQRIAYRVRQLQLAFPGFADNSKTLWQNDPVWQPLREAIEKLLTAYDWGESFVGLNLVLKPLVDQLFMKHLSDLALERGDYLLGQIFYSLDEDCQWHRQWTRPWCEWQSKIAHGMWEFSRNGWTNGTALRHEPWRRLPPLGRKTWRSHRSRVCPLKSPNTMANTWTP